MGTKPSVYLCGPINGCTDSECNDWRTYAREHLRMGILDPMRRDYRGRELEEGIASEIVKGDLEDIQACDYLLVWHPVPSTGTDMEVCIATREYKKQSCVVVPPGAPISPWLFVHSTIVVRSLEDAITWLNLRAK